MSGYSKYDVNGAILYLIPNVILHTLMHRQSGRHFLDDIVKCIFMNENVKISIKISLKSVSQGSTLQYSSIGSDNGLAPSRRQAIIWINGSIVYWRIYASLGLNELR